MERVQAASLRLADRAAARLESLWALVEQGDITDDEFVALAASTVAATNTAGVGLADAGLAAEQTRQTGRPHGPLGMAPTEVQIDQQRIAARVRATIAEHPDVARNADELAESISSRLAVLARSESFLTVATAVQTGMRERGAAGWVRQTDADPCPLCRDWDDGVARPVDVSMARHRGCACIQSPDFLTAATVA